MREILEKIDSLFDELYRRNRLMEKSKRLSAKDDFYAISILKIFIFGFFRESKLYNSSYSKYIKHYHSHVQRSVEGINRYFLDKFDWSDQERMKFLRSLLFYDPDVLELTVEKMKLDIKIINEVNPYLEKGCKNDALLLNQFYKKMIESTSKKNEDLIKINFVKSKILGEAYNNIISCLNKKAYNL